MERGTMLERNFRSLQEHWIGW